jgi:hypothetical protein
LTTIAVQADLAVLAGRIHSAWGTARTGQIQAWEGYMDVGALLIEARAQFPSDPLYGRWFEEQEFGFTPQWGGRLRRLAEDRPAVVALLDSALSGSGKLPGVDTLLALLNPPTPQAQSEGLDVDRPDPIYQPDHLRSAVVEISITYPIGTTKREEGSGHGSGAPRAEWHCELVMGTDIPDSLMTLEPFVSEMARRLAQEVRARPFKTMTA